MNRRVRGDLREKFQETFLVFSVISAVSMFWFCTQQPRFASNPPHGNTTPVQNTVSTAGPAAPRVRMARTTICIGEKSRYTILLMIIPTQPNFSVVNTADYRETYANSVQVRVNVWDFFLVFGTMQQQSENQVEVRNFQGIYLSPQQAKALASILQQNVTNYESTFGEIKLDPRGIQAAGPVH